MMITNMIYDILFCIYYKYLYYNNYNKKNKININLHNWTIIILIKNYNKVKLLLWKIEQEKKRCKIIMAI